MALESLKVHAPRIEGTWFNPPNLMPSRLRGRAVLVEFWDYTCVNCLRVLPYLKRWYERYRQHGLTVIGVHTPEFSFAKSQDVVGYAVVELGIEFPVVLDAHRDIWQAFANHVWPATYLIDKDGYVRYRHEDEGAYGEIEAAIQKLLREIDPEVNLPALDRTTPPAPGPQALDRPTPELYLGYERGSLGNQGGYNEESAARYHFQGTPQEGRFYARGKWLAHAEYLESAAGGHSSVLVKYSGAAASVVMAPAPGRLQVEVVVRQDDSPITPDCATPDISFQAVGLDDNETSIRVARPRLYFIVYNRRFGAHYLELICRRPGVRLYAFTFSGSEAPEIEERQEPAA